jgi:CheY-like chemotaxis protein
MASRSSRLPPRQLAPRTAVPSLRNQAFSRRSSRERHRGAHIPALTSVSLLRHRAEPVGRLLRNLSRSSRGSATESRSVSSIVSQFVARSSGEQHPSCSADLPRMLTATGAKTTVLVGLEPDRHPAFLAAGQAGRLDVYFCNDGQSALELAKSVQVDAWVIASVLPDMVGLRLRSILEHRRRTAAASPGLKGMPALPTSKRAPVVFLVAARQDEVEERRALEAGVHGYLVDDGPKRAASTSPAPAAEDSETSVSTAVAIHQSQRRNQSPPRTRGSPVETPPLGGLFRCSAEVASREPYAVIGLPAVMAATGLVACG